MVSKNIKNCTVNIGELEDGYASHWAGSEGGRWGKHIFWQETTKCAKPCIAVGGDQN